MTSRTVTITGAVCTTVVATAAILTNAGPLAPPPGPIGPTNKTLAEIEPRIAVNAVNTPAESDSLFTISQPGSYYLTDNIIGAAGKHGVKITTSDVTLDLNGYALLGVENSLDGVHVSAAGAQRITIRNGSVVGWFEDGVDLSLASRCVVVDVRAESNAHNGLKLGNGSMVAGCSVSGNFSDGLVAGSNCSILHTSASLNQGDGVTTGAVCLVNDVDARANKGSGIVVSSNSLVTGSRAMDNGNLGLGNGVECLNTCAIVGNTVSGNARDGVAAGPSSMIVKNVASGNGSAGITAQAESFVAHNTCVDNVDNDGLAMGIRVLGEHSRVENNRLTGNDRGVVVFGSQNLVIGNFASGNTTNYDIAAGNKVGVVVEAPASTAVQGATGGAGMGTTDPWANVSF